MLDFIKRQRPSRRADERVEVRATSCPWYGKLSLKEDEPQVGQRHEDVNMKREYYHIIIFLKRFEIVHQERRGQMKTIVMEHFNGILFHKSGPANKQHTNQPTNQSLNQEPDLLYFAVNIINFHISWR